MNVLLVSVSVDYEANVSTIPYAAGCLISYALKDSQIEKALSYVLFRPRCGISE